MGPVPHLVEYEVSSVGKVFEELVDQVMDMGGVMVVHGANARARSSLEMPFGMVGSGECLVAVVTEEGGRSGSGNDWRSSC